ncbi:MAG: hypothetical protein IJW19_00220 [Clostridia bacterium]|nr:hypothetical protein [Clostridia bacterium]
MKKLIALILTLTLILTALLLTSCSQDLAPDGEPIPDDMKIASNTAMVNYLLFVPEYWIIDTQTSVTMAHASSTDFTSIQVMSKKLDGEVTNLDSWWNEYKEELTGAGKVQYITQNEKIVIDGIAGKKAVYKITVDSTVITDSGKENVVSNTYKCMVVGVIKGDSVYVILYNSVENEKGDLFEANMEDVDSMLESFRFTDRLYPTEGEPKDEENIPDGMKIASNTDVVDYTLYIPENWIVDIQTGVTMAHVSEKDKSSIQVGQWSYNDKIKDYETWWQDYKYELSLVGEYEIITEPTEITVAGVSSRKAEYKLTTANGEYKCLVIGVENRGSMYVIVYMSTENGYEANMEEVNRIVENFKFN